MGEFFNKRIRKINWKRITMATTQTTPIVDDNKPKFHLRESISLGAFLAYVFGLIGFMVSLGMIDYTFEDNGFKLVIWAIFWAFMLSFGFEKGSILKFGMNILRVLFDPKMSNEGKLVFIKEQIEKLVGVAYLLNQQTDQTGLTSLIKPDKSIMKPTEKKPEDLTPIPIPPIPPKTEEKK